MVRFQFVSILIFLDSSFLYVKPGKEGKVSSKMSQSLFSWIHLSYANRILEGWAYYNVCLNPYFPGFIFLIAKSDSPFRSAAFTSLNPYFPGFIFLIWWRSWTISKFTMLSQSLFSWIHLSYEILSYALSMMESVSILFFLDSSFLSLGLAVGGSAMEMSQSLFSWIHLSYQRSIWH